MMAGNSANYLLLMILSAAFFCSPVLSLGVNGGMGCATCTFVVGLTEQLAAINNVSVVEFVSHNLCQLFQGQVSLLCGFLVTIWGPAVVEKLMRNETPDVVCYSLGICHLDAGQQYCHLFPAPQVGFQEAIRRSRTKSKIIPAFPWFYTEGLPDICHLPGVQQVCDFFVGSVTNHLPTVDVDRDKFSVIESFRGSLWRGRDCDDINDLVYPGRKPLAGDAVVDANCNGIMGVNATTSVPLEKELCLGDERGVIYIGDSVGARFHLPPEWFTAEGITKDTFQNISQVISNQFDWPQMGFSTGFRDVNWSLMSSITDSLYSRLRDRNLCNHKDYQNICFNGAESNTMLPFLPSISRHSTRDKPALVFYALMGNDVCKRHMISPVDNKSPEAYRSYVVESLNILDAMLPNGSYVVLLGLVDGSFIFPTMSHRIHPIGKLRSDVTYTDVYDWWNCMQVGPCFGWMNKNPEYRNATTQLAKRFTAILRDVAATENFNSFKIKFLENPLPAVATRWQQDGKPLHTLLEPVDSLHPVQAAQPYITEEIWSTLESQWPEALGAVNPHNKKIFDVFGDQGGH